MGGFGKVVVDWSPEMEGLDAGDGRRMDRAGFFITLEAAAADPVSGRSDLGLERSRIAGHETNLGMMKRRQGWQFVVSQTWRMLCII